MLAGVCGAPLSMRAEGKSKKEVPSLWPFLALCAVLALWIDLGSHHHCWHHSDSILPMLISLYRWTFFCWDCNRIGSLLPLLALPFQHPLTNLLVQNWLGIFGGLASLVLLCRYLLRDATWPPVAALAVSAFLVLAPEQYRFEYLNGYQPYGVSLALCLGGLLLLEKNSDGVLTWKRWLPALGLVLLAHWVNTSMALVFGPVVVLRCIVTWLTGQRAPTGAENPAELPGHRQFVARLWRSRYSETAVSLLLLAIGVGIFSVLMRLAPCQETKLGLLPWKQWPEAWRQCALNTWASLQPHRWPKFLLATAAVGVLAHTIHAVRRQAATTLRVVPVLVLAAALYGMGMGTLNWLQMNGFAGRYMTPAVLFLQTALATVAGAPLCVAFGKRFRQFVQVATGPILLLVAADSYGLPSLTQVHADIDQRLGTRTADILAAGCTHVCGTYWNVWSSVYHANLTLYERGQDRVIWGVTYRCLPSRDLWSRMPTEQLRIGAVVNDVETPYARCYLEMLCPLDALTKTEHGGLSVYQLRPGQLYCTWPAGFFGLEGTGQNTWRWCTSQGELVITNPTQESRTIALAMTLRTGQEKPSHLWIKSSLFAEELEIDSQSGFLSKTVKIAPGKHEIRFISDAKKMNLIGENRSLVFRVINFTLQDTAETAPKSTMETTARR